MKQTPATQQGTFLLEGAATNGVLTFNHSETTQNRMVPTGTGTLQ